MASSATALVKGSARGMMTPNNLDDAMRLADMLAKSDLVSKDYKNKPGNVLVAVQQGAELGLSPMQALQNISVINGRPSVWGDALLAICQGHPDCEDIIEKISDSVASCTVKRKGREPLVRTFSVDDAKKARLWGKQGPWSQYPDRMLQMRARGFALRDAFADALRGIISAEEARDIPTEEVNVTPEPTPAPPVAEKPSAKVDMTWQSHFERGYIKATKADSMDELNQIAGWFAKNAKHYDEGEINRLNAVIEHRKQALAAAEAMSGEAEQTVTVSTGTEAVYEFGG